MCVCLCQIAKTTAQCQMVEFIKRFIYEEKNNIDFIFDQFQFHSATTELVSIGIVYNVLCIIALLFLFSLYCFLSFNRKQMVALFRLSPIQLTHCKLLLYNRLVQTNEHVRFILNIVNLFICTRIKWKFVC